MKYSVIFEDLEMLYTIYIPIELLIIAVEKYLFGSVEVDAYEAFFKKRIGFKRYIASLIFSLFAT